MINKFKFPLISFICFSALFLPLIIDQRLPDNNSTWFGISQFNMYYAKLFGTQGGLGSYLFPSPSILWSDSFLMHFPLYALYKIMGINEFYSYWLYLISIFTINSSSLYLLSTQYLKSKTSQILCVVTFCCSNFTFGNIGDPPALFYAFIFLTLYHLNKYKEINSKSSLFLAAFFAGAQVFSMAYVNFFLNLILIIYFLFNLKIFKNILLPFYSFLIVVNFAFFIPYFKNIQNQNFQKVYNNKASATLHSFNSIDEFFKKIPGNLYNKKGDLESNRSFLKMIQSIEDEKMKTYIYPFLSKEAEKLTNMADLKGAFDKKTLYHQLRKSGFIGFLVILLFFLGLKKANREFIVFSIMGILLSLGPLFYIKGSFYKTPLFYFYEFIPYFDFFRVPSRAYFIFLFAVSFIAAKGLELIEKKWSLKTTSYLFIGFVLMENIPGPILNYKYFDPPNELINYLNNTKNKNVLFLPSKLGLYYTEDDKDIFPYSREYLYMNWKSYIPHSILNGNGAYLPKTRLQLQKSINSSDLEKLRYAHKVDIIVYYKKLKDQKNMTPYLSSSKILKKTLETDEFEIYEYN
ncbi:MAG: hypothetical protein OEY33_07805 [Bdellovibrionales bacterium]|jgi:hypothetical protein|nr:hypothetical protein [Bdellovibrionales bacterium]